MPKKSKPGASGLRIPEEIFHAIAAIANRLIYISEKECHVEPITVLILWHTRHFGKPHKGEPCILRQELTRMLKEKFRYTDADISKLLAKIQDDGFITRANVSSQERIDLFGGSGGTQVVILNDRGNSKIEEVKDI